MKFTKRTSDKKKDKKTRRFHPITSTKSTLKEMKHIEWCKPKEWLKSSAIVFGIGAILAVMLTGFDIVSSFVVTSVTQLHLMSNNQAVQITVFVIGLILLIACGITASKGDNVLNGFTSTSSALFEKQKSGKVDKKVVIGIWVFTALYFMLIMFLY